MKKHHIKRYSPLFLLALFIPLVLLQAQGAVAKLELNVTQFQCQGTTISGAYSVTARDSGGSTLTGDVDTVRHYVTSNGSTVQSGLITTGQSLTFSLSFPGAALTFGQLEITLAADPSVTSGVYYFDCTTGTVTAPTFTDGRLNPGKGDLAIVLYRGVGDDGKAAVDVYRVEGTEGIFVGRYDYSLFASYLSTPPATNTLLDSVDSTRLYALTSGQFQIVIESARDSKTFDVIFTGIPPVKVSASER